jgi:hypothetical protein
MGPNFRDQNYISAMIISQKRRMSCGFPFPPLSSFLSRHYKILPCMQLLVFGFLRAYVFFLVKVASTKIL